MKKKNLNKSLSLNKNVISNLNLTDVKGGQYTGGDFTVGFCNVITKYCAATWNCERITKYCAATWNCEQ